ncbi:hypothetical protein LL912_02850 [Niabella sp. CC-SYL272]|uniref:hypothetical protein n=1 Tax=Niabella agricola TaxID=2891571 RepID=UPI001F3D5881|nr:hypothetical protein [Niabella agricola]MCF3107711.1 hypothetical protein [Niabella agricola]
MLRLLKLAAMVCVPIEITPPFDNGASLLDLPVLHNHAGNRNVRGFAAPALLLVQG